MKFSLLLPVYHKDTLEWLTASLDSIIAQTKLPTEVIVLQDGDISLALQQKIKNFQKTNCCQWLKFKGHKGLANILNEGLKNAKYNWVARLDSDDINLPDRYQKQIDFLEKNPEVDLVGGYCLEFDTNPNGPYQMKKLPLTTKKIHSLLKKRNAINHVSVFYRKSSVLQTGGYESYLGMEDYHLWVKMILKGFCLRNIPEKLILQRAGKGMIDRRGGWKYFWTEVRLQIFFLKVGFINLREFFRNLAVRLILRSAPSFFRKKIYSQIRKNI